MPGPTDSGKCPSCYLPTALCICELATHSACTPRAQLVVLRHHLERHKPSNTGRWVHRLLAGSQLVDYGAKGAMIDDAIWLGAPTALLYPGGRSELETPPARVLVLDGSWPQTRRMHQRISSLRGLPVISLSDPEAPLPRMRRSPAPGHLSTAEAAVSLLRLVGDEVAADALEAFHHELTRRFAIPSRRSRGGLRPGRKVC